MNAPSAESDPASIWGPRRARTSSAPAGGSAGASWSVPGAQIAVDCPTATTYSRFPATMDLCLTGGRVIDPARNVDGEADVLVRDGVVAQIGPGIAGGLRGRARIVDV